VSGVVEQVRHLIGAYRRFIKSSYRLADDHLRVQFEEHVDGAEVLVKGPYVTLARDFLAERTLIELLAEGLGDPRLAKLHWAFRDGPLFKHQENAFRAVVTGRNAVVKTGTASGKTEAFLLPILSGILRAKMEGVTGTQALLLYPMNALANDQLERLRALIGDSGVPITFALYTGESETIAGTLGTPVAGHELTKRDEIRRAPPDIILTNYKQLEFLLIRQADRRLFSRGLRHLVLDELHSYRGALATEIACLIRRLKARCDLQPGELRCIGTSATVSQDHGGDRALASFAAGLFDEPFALEDVIGEIYDEEPPTSQPYVPPIVVPTDEELRLAATGDSRSALELAERFCGHRASEAGSDVARLTALLSGNVFVDAVREAAREPRTYEELAVVVRPKLGSLGLDATPITDDALARMIEMYVAIGSIGDEDEPPLLRPKLHSFFHGVYDVGLCLNPECRTLVRDGSDACPECKSAVRPAVLCRTCGQDFAKVRVDPDDPSHTLPNDDFFSDDSTGFLTPSLIGTAATDADEAGAPEDAGGDESGESGNDSTNLVPVDLAAAARLGPGRKPRAKRASARAAAATAKWRQVWVDHASGRFFVERPADAGLNVRQQWMLRGRGTTCPVCKSRYNRGDVLTLLRTGVASSVSVIAARHLDRVPDAERKLLVFADNRQEAAHQAGYMNDRHRQFAVRHVVEALVRQAGEGGISLEAIPARLLTAFQDLAFARRRLTRDELRQWTEALRYEAASEFCRGTLQRVSLENLALVAIEYEFLDELLADPEFSKSCAHWGVAAGRRDVVVRAMLDFVRRRRAVALDFYQQYIDEQKAPWRYLTEDPYSVAFPEYERSPVAFMLDRPAAAKHPVGGFSFQALVKDSPRGRVGGIAALVRRGTGLPDHGADGWTRDIIALLVRHGILEDILLPGRVRQRVGAAHAYQISPRVIRLVSAGDGWRCELCSTWRPYRAPVCLASTVCAGQDFHQKPSRADRENYYIQLYTGQRPRRLKALEHTAQIAEEDRARREAEFKSGTLDVLVCSPTLELGVDIGQLPSIVMRNAAPAPSNYLQRAGRAGRRLRIGFVSTFCGMGSHDRHCFEDPPWLVRGEFRPPQVRLTNDRIVRRHVRSLALEELNADFSWTMGDLLADPQDPTTLDPERLRDLVARLRATAAVTGDRAALLFHEIPQAAQTVDDFSTDLEAVVTAWHGQVRRLHDEFRALERIISTREVEQRRRARQRAYRELTVDRNKAHILTYLADVGLLPSYQFPTDTFALEPGVADTPTLRRPAWIALFEFAPGNLVYANGHKLKSIRAFFNGGGGRGNRGADQSGRVESYCFCDKCGFAAPDVLNNCPRCAAPIETVAPVALLESFEAEENTQITSAEDARQRLYFDRRENILDAAGAPATHYAYEFVTLEHRERARMLVTNWGKQARRGQRGERFELCPECGRHRPSGLAGAALTRWEDGHRRLCNGAPRHFVLGYEFIADVLTLPVASALVVAEGESAQKFARTLGKALVAGAQELLELEPDELAFMSHRGADGGSLLTFYETAPGGAGYLAELASRLPEWARFAYERLYGHTCDRACYRCLKSYRNQYDHALLDKRLVRDVLFHFSHSRSIGVPQTAVSGSALDRTRQWLEFESTARSRNGREPESAIERALLEAIRIEGLLPLPVAQHEIRLEDGTLLTIPDFAYPAHKLAIFCDGFAFHGTADALVSDAKKRNALQARGWTVLTFWGKQVLREPSSCVDQIRVCFEALRDGQRGV
jgi:ATP-dependent helicase YprA (DUF1998 family)/very-short-patch-repair endonuclease